MNPIKHNPYRTLGLLAGATAREQSRQISRLKQYIAAERETPTDDYSFPVLGNLIRTLESIEDAASKLNLDSDKMTAALFWFWHGNPIFDDVAFDALKEGDIDQAYQIYDRQIVATKDGKRFWKTVNDRNCSAFHNYFVLEMLHAKGNKQNAIVANLYFLESEFSQKFISTITDSTHKTNAKELQINFLNDVLQEIEQGNINLTLSKFVSIINNLNFTAKADFLKKISQKLVSNISTQIETSKKKRSANNATAAKTGEALSQQTKNDLEQLKSIVGVEDFAYTNIADKVANEILQCGIDYFLHYRDTNTDPSAAAMDLFKKAKTLAVGNVTKQRCDEQTEQLKEWIDNEPERIKQKRIKSDLDNLLAVIQEFEAKTTTTENAKQLIDRCKPYLANAKSTLGSSDDLYLKLSTRVASQALHFIIEEINKVQTYITAELQKTYDQYGKVALLEVFKKILEQAWSGITLIGTLDMEHDFRVNRYNTNKATLKSLCDQLGVSAYSSSTSSTDSSKSGGCYIATMAYGSYEHPQVMILRQFRDEVLDTSKVGKWVIKTYYHYSPKLVERLKDRQMANKFIRSILNQFIKVIK